MSEREPEEPQGAPPGETEAGASPEGAAAEEAKAKAAAAAKAKAEAAAAAKAEREAAEAAKPVWERDAQAPEPVDAADDPLAVALADGLIGATRRGDELALDVERGAIVEVATRLRDEHGFALLVDLCGVHYPEREGSEFEVVYHLFNLEANRRVRLRVRTADGESVPSVTPVWVGANWLEREAYDMYGLTFEGHPDMTRILLWEGFNGFPLRKDFPVEGIDTGSAIYPEYYEEQAGPVAGTGTGWKPAAPPEPAAAETGEAAPGEAE